MAPHPLPVVIWRCGCCGMANAGPVGDIPSVFGTICSRCGLVVCVACGLRHRRRGCPACQHTERSRLLSAQMRQAEYFHPVAGRKEG